MGCKILQMVSGPGRPGVQVTGHAFCEFAAGVAAGVPLREGLLKSTSTLTPKRS